MNLINALNAQLQQMKGYPPLHPEVEAALKRAEAEYAERMARLRELSEEDEEEALGYDDNADLYEDYIEEYPWEYSDTWGY